MTDVVDIWEAREVGEMTYSGLEDAADSLAFDRGMRGTKADCHATVGLGCSISRKKCIQSHQVGVSAEAWCTLPEESRR